MATKIAVIPKNKNKAIYIAVFLIKTYILIYVFRSKNVFHIEIGF